VTRDKQIQANRVNAARSAGPRTAAIRDAPQRRRHGLAASLRLEPGTDEEVEMSARAIAGKRAHPDSWTWRDGLRKPKIPRWPDENERVGVSKFEIVCGRA
jgi:hypothetical protein